MERNRIILVDTGETDKGTRGRLIYLIGNKQAFSCMYDAEPSEQTKGEHTLVHDFFPINLNLRSVLNDYGIKKLGMNVKEDGKIKQHARALDSIASKLQETNDLTIIINRI